MMNDPARRIGNPYVIGRPIYEPELFFGREKLVSFLSDQLEKHTPIVLVHGQRRIGKSTVLRQIPAKVGADRFAFISFDLQDQAQSRLSRVLHDLAAQMVKQLGLAGTLAEPSVEALESDPSVFAEVFLPAAQKARPDRLLVLLLDEFDVLASYSGEEASQHFFPYLRTIVNKQIVSIVAVVGRRLDELPQLLSLFSGAPYQEIGLLDEAGARRLIVEPARGVLEFEEDAIEAILGLTGGHPYFTQLMCHTVFATARANEATKVTGSEVAGAVDDALESGEAGLTWFRDGLPIAERVLFAAACEAQERGRVTEDAVWTMLGGLGVVQTPELFSALPRLREWKLLSTDLLVAPQTTRTNTRAYRVVVELVRRWMIKRHSAKWEVKQLADLHPECQGLVEEAQAKRGSDLDAAAETLRRCLKINPNHFPAIFELAEVAAELDEPQESVELYRRAYAADRGRAKQGFVQALVSLGRDLQARGDQMGALGVYNEALRVEPDNRVARKRLGSMGDAAMHEQAVQWSKNPFVAGPPVSPHDFIGRSQELATMFSTLASGGSVVIYGPRRIGKSSMLKYIRSADMRAKFGLLVKDSSIVHVNCAAVVPFSNQRLFQEVLETAHAQNALNVSDGTLPALTPEVRDAFRTVRAMVSTAKEPFFLLLDEAEVGLRSSPERAAQDVAELSAELRSLVEGTPISLVLATEHSPESLFANESAAASPLFGMFQAIPLGGLTPAEVSSYLARVGESLNLGAVELRWIDLVAGRHPYLLQSALSVLYPMQSSRGAFDVARATKELLLRVKKYVERLWEDSTPAERSVLVAITMQGSASLLSLSMDPDLVRSLPRSLQKEMEDMALRGIVLEREGRVRLTSILVEWHVLDWLREAEEEAVSEVLDPRSDAQKQKKGLFQPQSVHLEKFSRVSSVEDAVKRVRALPPSEVRLEEWSRYRLESEEE